MEEVLFRNAKELTGKIQNIQQAGASSLHVISDFDSTLTKRFVNGIKIPSGIGLIRQGGYLTKEYPKLAFALFDKYHPYEKDPFLSEEDRDKYMQEWWTQHLELLVEKGMNKEVVEDIVAKNNKMLRNKCTEVCSLLAQHQVPLLLFSAGSGDIIQGILHNAHILTDNVRIISNFYRYDQTGRVVGYQGDIIHTFNKNEVNISDERITRRRNVILLGDSLGDPRMGEGKEHDNIIKIGFLNEEVEEKKELYLQLYDVVITHDASMDYVLSLLKKILS